MIIDFTVYNPSRQLMTVVKVLAEFTAMGAKTVVFVHFLSKNDHLEVVKILEAPITREV